MKTQLLASASVVELLDELKRRGFDAVELRDKFDELVSFTYHAEKDKDGGWPSEFTEAEAALRAWDSAMEQEQ